MSLTPDQIRTIASRAAANALENKTKSPETPREKSLRLQGEVITRQLDNGVNYRGPWLPEGPEGELLGHFFQDDAVTQTSFVCQDIDDCKAKLIKVREDFKAEPPVFTRTEDVVETVTRTITPGRSQQPFEAEVTLVNGKYRIHRNSMNKADQAVDVYGHKAVWLVIDDSTGQFIKGGFGTRREAIEFAIRREPAAFTKQENVKPCPNLMPMAEWIKGEEPGTCRPCTLSPVVQWYYEELKEKGHEDIAADLESLADDLEEDNMEQVMGLCQYLDEIKSSMPAELRKRLEEFDCAIQSFDPSDVSGEEASGDSSA